MTPLPPIVLSHLMLWTDEQTYQDMAGCSFLQETFAWFEQRTTLANDNRSWTGLYFYGEQNYFEFLDPRSTPWRSPDGVAFALNTPADRYPLRDQLQQALDKEILQVLRTRTYQEHSIPWFDYIGFNRTQETALWTWVMSFHEGFLQNWHPELPTPGGTSHKAVLARYRAQLAQGTPSSAKRYFKDIIEVTLALPPAERDLFAREVVVYGYQLHQEGEVLLCKGVRDTLRVLPATASMKGIVSFKMALQTLPTQPWCYRFGPRAKLSSHPDQTASWTFY